MPQTTAAHPAALGLVGSPRRNGNTQILVDTILEGAREAGATTNKVDLTRLNIQPCLACDACRRKGKCVHKDDFAGVQAQMLESRIWVFGSPIYWWGPSAQFKLFLDRWYGVEEPFKLTPGRRVILALAFAEKEESTADPLVAILSNSAKWIHQSVYSVLLAPEMDKAGDIRQRQDILDKAYEIGRQAVLD